MKTRIKKALLAAGYPITQANVDAELPDTELAAIKAKHEGRITVREYRPGDLGGVDPWEDIPPELEKEYQKLQEEYAQGKRTTKLAMMSDGKVHYIRPYWMDAVKKAGGTPYVVIQDGQVRYFQWHRADRPGHHPVKPTELPAVAEAHRQQLVEDETVREAVEVVQEKLHAKGVKPVVRLERGGVV
jgi:hypothetical protein